MLNWIRDRRQSKDLDRLLAEFRPIGSWSTRATEHFREMGIPVDVSAISHFVAWGYNSPLASDPENAPKGIVAYDDDSLYWHFPDIPDPRSPAGTAVWSGELPFFGFGSGGCHRAKHGRLQAYVLLLHAPNEPTDPVGYAQGDGTIAEQPKGMALAFGFLSAGGRDFAQSLLSIIKQARNDNDLGFEQIKL